MSTPVSEQQVLVHHDDRSIGAIAGLLLIAALVVGAGELLVRPERGGLLETAWPYLTRALAAYLACLALWRFVHPRSPWQLRGTPRHLVWGALGGELSTVELSALRTVKLAGVGDDDPGLVMRLKDGTALTIPRTLSLAEIRAISVFLCTHCDCEVSIYGEPRDHTALMTRASDDGPSATSEDDARFAIQRGLEKALAAQREGRLHTIGVGWRTAASFEHRDPTLSLALTFWDRWADAAAHGWLSSDGLRADDWPRTAVTILDALERHQPISDPAILAHFAPTPLRRLRLRTRLRLFPHPLRMVAWLLSLLAVLGSAAALLAAMFAIRWDAGAGTCVLLFLGTLIFPFPMLDLTQRLSASVERWLIRAFS